MRKMARKIGPRSVGALGLTALACAGLAAAAFAGVVGHDTKLTGGHKERNFYHGQVKSAVHKCVVERRVALFKVRPGADRKVGTDLTDRRGWWEITRPGPGRVIARVGLTGRELRVADERAFRRSYIDQHPQLTRATPFYAKVMRKQNLVSGNGYVCRADREPNRGTYRALPIAGR